MALMKMPCAVGSGENNTGFDSVTQIRSISLSGTGATYALNEEYKCVIGCYPYTPDNFATKVVVGNDTDGWKAPDLYIQNPDNSTGECGVWYDVPQNSYFKSLSGGWGFSAVLFK